MIDLIQLKQKRRTGFVLLFAVLTSLALLSCKKLDWTKVEPLPPPGDAWLHYDNGNNHTGISANSGEAFDIAIRFNTTDIASYQGFVISKVKFFPVVGYPASYYITLWKGEEPPELLKVQSVSSVIDSVWNEVNLDELFLVDSSKDLWVGIWIEDYPAGTYPAGCDSGPAIAGKGDLYSIDDGASWYSLYDADDLNYNWNLQVFLTSPSGEKVTLGSVDTFIARDNKEALKNAHAGPGNDRMISQKMNPAHENK